MFFCFFHLRRVLLKLEKAEKYFLKLFDIWALSITSTAANWEKCNLISRWISNSAENLWGS